MIRASVPYSEKAAVIARSESWLGLVVFLGLAAIGCAVLAVSNALESALVGHPDEAAHYVTGLMVHQYLRDAPGRDPVGFAQRYYLHYPKVAIGHWPPVFPFVVAGWMLAVGTSIAAVLVLQVLLAAAVGAVLFATLKGRTGEWLACTAAGLWMLLRLSQESYVLVMAEPLLALFVLLATISVARYLESGRMRPLVEYAVASTFAVMTKGSGLALLALPVLAALLTGRWAYLRDWRIHVAPVGVVVASAPWTLLTFPMVRDGFDPRGASMDVMAEQAATALLAFVPTLGVGLAIPVLAGIVWPLASLHSRTRLLDPLWGSSVATVLALYAIHIVSPTFMAPRRVLVVLPALIALAVLAMHRIASRFRIPVRIAAAGLIVLAMVSGGGVPRKGGERWRAFVRDELGPALRPGTAVLIAGQEAENAIISETAQRQPSPSVFLVRASKFVANSDWSGADYRLRPASPQALGEALRRVPINIVVVEREPLPSGGRHREPPHVALVRATVRRPDGPWRLAQQPAVETEAAGVQVAEIYTRHPPLEGRVQLTVDLRRKLGHALSTGNSQ